MVIKQGDKKIMKQFQKILFTAITIFFASTTVFAQKEIIVAQDGSGNFKSIQEAINSLPADAKAQRIILVKMHLQRQDIH